MSEDGARKGPTTSQYAGGAGIAVAVLGAATAFFQAQGANSNVRDEAVASKVRAEVLYEVMRKELTAAREDVKVLKKEARRLSDEQHALRLELATRGGGPSAEKLRSPRRVSEAPPQAGEGAPDFVLMDEPTAASVPEPAPEPMPANLDQLMEQEAR